MHPPFTADQFLDVFRRYHEAVWPAPMALTAAGILAAVAAYAANRRRSWRWAQTSMVLLAALWLWAGIAYHKAFFATLTPAGAVFGSLFIAQAALLLISATQNGGSFDRASRGSLIVGTSLVAYACVVYPAIAIALGHHFPSAPSFGTPCPTTIFTFGIFCLLPASIPRFALAIPVLWAAVGSTAAVELGMREDAGLVIAALAAIVVIHQETHHHAPVARTVRRAVSDER